MKKTRILSVIMCIITFLTFAQSSIKKDTLLGENGIFKRFKPKDIVENQKIHFNLKILFSGKDKRGKDINGCILMNTKYGYMGMIMNKDKTNVNFNPDEKGFNMMLFSNSLQNFTFHTDNRGKKTVLSMPFNPNNKNETIDIKKSDKESKLFAPFTIKAFPYSNGVGKTKGIRYFTDSNLSNTSKFSNQLAYAGLGFYQVGGKTILCTAMEMEDSYFEIDKIEATNTSLDMSEFQKEKSGISSEMINEMMKKLKKN